MYRETTALRGNPFGPTFPADDRNLAAREYLADLDRLPLRMDQCAEVRPLFCHAVLDLGTHIERFHELMEERGYEFNPPQRGLNSALVLIRGVAGAGKTTLGAWMIAELAKLPGAPWQVVHIAEGAWDKEALKAKITSSMPGHLAVLVENVSRKVLDSAIELYNELPGWPRLFVLTTHELGLLDADERVLGGSARIDVVTLRSVTSADADAYVEHRIPLYRDPARAEILALSPVFPFASGLAGSFVQKTASQGEALPIALRQLNAHFLLKLTAHAKALKKRPDFIPVAQAAPQDLPGYLLPDL